MNSGSIKRMTIGLPFVILAVMLLLHRYPLGPTVKPSPTAQLSPVTLVKSTVAYSVTATPIRTASATATATKAASPCPVLKGFKVNQVFTIKGYEAQTLLDRHGCPAILVIMPLKANGDVQANR